MHERQLFTSRSFGNSHPDVPSVLWLLFAAVEVQDTSHRRATRQLRYDIPALVAVNKAIIVIVIAGWLFLSYVLETKLLKVPFQF
jgi:hypothetical protein